MKNNHNTIVSSPYKLFNPPLQPSNLLSLILFFAFGLSFGILLTFQLKNVSFNFRFNDFATTTTTTTIMGLQDFMYPSKTTHNMTDQELIWRASMVPKVRKYPYERIPKVAFMFLTRGPVLMSPLWEMFFQGYNGLFTVYVHMSNSSFNWTVPEDSVFRDRKIPSQVIKEFC
ncbi:putative glycosyl transferase, family 14 [Helianthus anomalus]